jgi:hypothetical protein
LSFPNPNDEGAENEAQDSKEPEIRDSPPRKSEASSRTKFVAVAVIAVLVVAVSVGLYYSKTEGYLGQVCTTETLNDGGTSVMAVDCTSDGATSMNVCASSCASTTSAGTQALYSQYGLGGANVESVTLSSATLYGGTTATGSSPASSSLVIGFSNPGSTTYATSVTLIGSGIGSIIAWDSSSAPSSSNNQIVWTSAGAGINSLPGGEVSSFTWYPVSSSAQSILTGEVFNYQVDFANGQSVSGSLIAQ